MKTIKILSISFLAILLMSFQCESEEATTETQCDCDEVRYTLRPGDISYQFHSRIDRPDLDCEDETSSIQYTGTYHTQIVCE